MATQAQKSNHISNMRQNVSQLLNATNELIALRAEWDALGLSSDITDDNFIGENTGLVTADLASVYTSLVALQALLAQGHATNLYKIRI